MKKTKKILSATLAFFTTLLSVFGAVGCGNETADVGSGSTLSDGEISSEAGESDTQENDGGNDSSATETLVWDMQSVYARATALGYTGSLEEFIAEVSGTDGRDGVGIESIYINQNGELIVKLTDREAQNLGTVKGTDGQDGDDGKSAYEIAVENGFAGDEEAWLLSLKGTDGEDGLDGDDGQSLDIRDMYEAACAEGYEGSLLDFMKELGLSFNVQEDNATDIIHANMSSVVNIYCAFQKEVEVSSGLTTQTKTSVKASAGSGVVVHIEKERGVAYVVTNYHVIYESMMNGVSDCIWLYPYGARVGFTRGDADGDGYLDDGATQGNNEYGDGIEATFVAGAMDYDIALLEVNSTDIVDSVLTAATLGDSNEVTVGEKVFAIGNSNGEGISVTNGIVSVDSETITMSATDGTSRSVDYRVMRTDAAINHGNSGGGLFNAKGELIGITNAKSVEDETDNMGYALPITNVKYLLENMWENKTSTEAGYVKRAWLGVETYIDSSKAEMKNGKLELTETFVVSKIIGDGAASASTDETKSLKTGDVFKSVTIGGETIELTRRYQLNDLMLRIRKGDTVTFGVVRDGVETDIAITFDSDDHFVVYG